MKIISYFSLRKRKETPREANTSAAPSQIHRDRQRERETERERERERENRIL